MLSRCRRHDGFPHAQMSSVDLSDATGKDGTTATGQEPIIDLTNGINSSEHIVAKELLGSVNEDVNAQSNTEEVGNEAISEELSTIDESGVDTAPNESALEASTNLAPVQSEEPQVEGKVDGVENMQSELDGQVEPRLMSDASTSGLAVAFDERDVAETIAEQASTSAGEPQNELSELRRLRDLVFASRGSKASLPAGWDDDDEGDKEPVAPQEPLISLSNNVPEHVSAAQKMLQRAISLVGEMASDSDSDSDESSSSESDSASSSSSSTTTSRSTNKKARRKAPVREVVSSDDEDAGTGGGGKGPTTKNEVLEPTVDPPPFSIVPAETEIRPLGKVHSVVDCVVVVAQDVGKAPGQQQHQPNYQAPVDMHGRKGEEKGEYSVLDTGSVLAFNDRNVLGVVFETFGSVLSPLYALRYPSASHINRDMIQVGKAVSYVPRHSTYVLTRSLRALGKGSDASNLWDEEVGDDEREFSDDEAEASHKRSAKVAKGKGKKRGHPDEERGDGATAMAPPAGRPTKHILPARPASTPIHRDAEGAGIQSVALSYDDDDATVQPRAPPIPSQLHAMYQQPLQAPHHDPYAQWAFQQQQQQQQQPILPPLHFQGHSYPAATQYVGPSPSTPSFYHQPPPNSSNGDSYDPQQPLFGLARPPSMPWPPSRPPQ
jgi:hypothetical protein